MRCRNKPSSGKRGSIILEASLVMPVFIVIICTVVSSITAVNAELYMQRASENVVAELNVAIPFASNGIGSLDDLISSSGMTTGMDVNTSGIDEILGEIGTISGVTGVELSDVLCTAVFGRFVRDRIVAEYQKLTDNGWVYDKLVQNVSVYLDYAGSEKSVYIKVYYDICAGEITIPRMYCTSLAMYADAIPLAGGDTGKEGKTDSVWDQDNFDRGTAIRERFGGNLPYNFPVIGAFSGDEAVSIKSIDTTSPYYSEKTNLQKKIKSYIRDLEKFDGADYSGKSVMISPTTRKTLLLIVPENGSEECLQVISAMESYASERSVHIKVEKYEESHRYDEEKDG